MRQSHFFGKTLREAPKDAEAASHIYLTRGGFVKQLSSGLFSFLPLGFIVLKKLEQVIREELSRIGVQEMIMPVIHPAEIWKKTGRYHEIGKEMWRLKSLGGQESHEFMMPAEIGEDKLNGKNAIELGHAFKLGIKYSKPFSIFFTAKNGKKELAIMGSYGIGLDRLMAAVVEAHHDKNGIIWPEEAAPFKLHLIELSGAAKNVKKEAEKIYKILLDKGVEVLYDDRDDKSAGEKFADADLVGISKRIVISEKTLNKNSIEIKDRKTGKINLDRKSNLKNVQSII